MQINVTQENDIFKKNTELLARFQPEVYKKILNHKNSESKNEWEWITSNTNQPIPVYCKNHLIHSKYNPQKEAERFISTIPQEKVFTIILGFGAGYTAEELIKNKKSKYLIIETNLDLFFSTISKKDLSEVFSAKNIKIILSKSKTEIEKEILSYYFPATDGGLFCLEHRSLYEIFKTEYDAIKETIQDTIKKIKTDYSVQAHFGKVWTKNILSNSIIAKQNKELILQALKNIKNNQKKKNCIVLAAGPSLDYQLKKIINNQKEFCIIATDTAYQVAIKNGITPDFFISIDGQPYSNEQITNYLSNETTIIASLSANSSLIHNCVKNLNPVLFFKTNHPLEQFIFSGENLFPFIETGTGTVTISAISFAKEIGFTDLFILGNDFAYLDGKPYAKGTYLDSQIEKSISKVNNSETFFCSLMFRTTVKKEKTNNKTTYKTEIMDSYRKGTEDFIKGNDLTILDNKNIGINIGVADSSKDKKNNSNFVNSESEKAKLLSSKSFDSLAKNIDELISKISSNLDEFLAILQKAKKDEEPITTMLRPLMAWTSKNFPNEDCFTKSIKITDKIIKHFIL